MNQNNVNEAIEGIRKYVVEADALKKVIESLEHIGSLDNAAKETEARLASLRSQEVAAVDSLAAVKAEQMRVEKWVRDIDTSTQESVAKMVSEAEKRASEVIATASSQALAMIDEAKTIVSELDALAAFRREEITALDGERAVLQSKLDSLRKAISDAVAI